MTQDPKDLTTSTSPLDDLLKGPDNVIFKLAWNVEKLGINFQNMDRKLDHVLANAADKAEVAALAAELAKTNETVRVIEEVKIRALEDWKLKMYAYATVVSILVGVLGATLEHFWK